MEKVKNIAYIDWQNFHLWTAEDNWKVDFKRFRIYLQDKYCVEKVYYFLWYVKDENNWLYTKLQESGFIIVFKKQMIEMKSNKKWNIDSDLIFSVMEKLLKESNEFNKIVLVTWDGDFKILVDFLIKENRLEKILFPNKKYTSSLYNDLWIIYKDYLYNVKKKIEY